MERLLSTIFPCCFPTRRTSSPSERTPLLTDSSHPPHASSSRNSLADVGDDGTVTPGSVDARRLRKHNSVLPTPAYDAAVLRGIVDDFRSKLISVDSGAVVGEKSGSERLLSSLPAKVTSEGINVTPVHTLSLCITSTTRPSSTPKLLDIWSPSSTPIPTSTSPPTTTSKLTYSAAAKRAPPTSSKKVSKRLTKQPPPSLTLEQSTYQSLTNSISSKPIVHHWSLADEDTP